MKEEIVNVYYENECWKIINQPVRDSLLADLKDSVPSTRVTIEKCSNSRKKEVILLKEVTLDL